LTISCGAALHHARLALAAAGWTPMVQRFPDPADPDHLARVSLGEPAPATAQDLRLRTAIEQRHTDRRPTIETPISATVLDLIRQAAAEEGAGLHRVTETNLDDLASAAAAADDVGPTDPDQRAEMAYWIGGQRPANDRGPGRGAAPKPRPD
jgi:hypothetical protein